MNPSRIFILRPIATSLLMAAILLAGAVAYKQLPVSALPEVDYPTIQIITFYPGASPDVMASSVTAPLERQFGQVPGLAADDLHQFRWQLHHHSTVQPEPEHRRRGAGSSAVHQCRRNLPAARPSHASHLQQKQSRRCAGIDPGAGFQNACRCRKWRIWRIPAWRRKFPSCRAWVW